MIVDKFNVESRQEGSALENWLRDHLYTEAADALPRFLAKWRPNGELGRWVVACHNGAVSAIYIDSKVTICLTYGRMGWSCFGSM